MDFSRGTYAQQVRSLDYEIIDSPETAQCRAAVKQEPKNTKLLLELALAVKRQTYYYEASEIFSEILMLDPFNSTVLCHRGHVYIGIQAYKQAAADFEMALRINPTDWDSLYHIGLCYYLLGDYETAGEYYARCYAVSKTEEDLTAVADWYWLTLMHLDRVSEAQLILDRVQPDWMYGENEIYYTRLMVYKGLKTPDQVLEYARTQGNHEFCTYAYGIAYYMWKVQGRKEQACRLIEEIASRTDGCQWGSFALKAAQAAKKRGI